MDCKEFEAQLAELLQLDGSGEEPQRRPRVDRLRQHAVSCADCAGTRELLDLLALPAAERDLAPDPEESYWATFNDRLWQRIQRSASVKRVWPRWVAGSAASLLLALAGAWVGRDYVQPRPASNALAPATVLLEQRLSHAAPAEALAALEPLAGSPPWAGEQLEDGEDAALYPDVEQLDAEAQVELLQWLREQSS